MLYFFLAAFGLFALHKAKPPLVGAAMGGLPWAPPSSGSPTKTKSRDTSVTKFPVDVWLWATPGRSVSSYYLVIASDDPKSFIAYAISGPARQKILAAKGPGNLSGQIQARA